MSRVTDFVDPDYDRRLAEFKEEKARRKALADGQKKPDVKK